MTELSYEQMPPEFFRDINEVLDRYQIQRATTDVAAAILALPGEKRASTSTIFRYLVDSYRNHLPLTDFAAGERHAHARDLEAISGRPVSGWLQRAETTAAALT